MTPSINEAQNAQYDENAQHEENASYDEDPLDSESAPYDEDILSVQSSHHSMFSPKEINEGYWIYSLF